MDLQPLAAELKRRLGIRCAADDAKVVAGGSINQTYYLPTDRAPLFLKVNDPSALSMFEAEADGLAELRAATAVNVPDTVDVGRAGGVAYLALSWVDLQGKTAAGERVLGIALARQHRVTAERFGWYRENTIGATQQQNRLTSDWLDFLRTDRLGFQLKLASERGLPEKEFDRGQRLLGRLEWFFGDYTPLASLLHGDLWSGNWGCDGVGTPYIYDPAVYYGDREADLAMSRLFGGFGEAFHSAYQSEWPLETGWEARVDLYNLYHLLNHFNLFGQGYLGQTAGCLDRLLRACR